MSCPDCVRGFVHDGSPTGDDTSLGPLPAYRSFVKIGIPCRGILVILTDLFGHTFVNARLLADSYSASGFETYVPDICGGTPVNPATLDFLDTEGGGIFTAMRSFGRLMCAAPTLISFLSTHSRSVTEPRVESALKAARVLADERGLRLAAVGFCFGGRYALLGAKLGGALDACVAVHPSLVGKEDWEVVGKPTLLCIPENDYSLKPASARTAASAINSRGVRADVEVYKGVGHGFACRGGPSTYTQRAKCVADVISWLSLRFSEN